MPFDPSNPTAHLTQTSELTTQHIRSFPPLEPFPKFEDYPRPIGAGIDILPETIHTRTTSRDKLSSRFKSLWSKRSSKRGTGEGEGPSLDENTIPTNRQDISNPTMPPQVPQTSPSSGMVANYLSYGVHVMILFLLSFVTFILLILVTFSTPFIPTIYFLSVNNVNFGAFGWSSPGYKSADILGYEYGSEILYPFTSSQILWGIADIFSAFILFSTIPLLWVHENAALHAVASNTFFLFSSWSLLIVSSIAWCISIVGWTNARRAFEVASIDNHATLGAALWLGLVATILSFIMIVIGWPTDALGGTNGPRGTGYYHYRHTEKITTRPRVSQAAYA